MSRRPWMPFYAADFQVDTMGLRPEEIGVYMVLILLAWRNNGAVTAEMSELKSVLQRQFTDFHGHTFNRIVPKLLARYFEFRDGAYFQNRVVTELQKADKRSANQSQNANKRWSDYRKNNVLDYAKAIPSQSQSQRKNMDGGKEGFRARAESPQFVAWETYAKKEGQLSLYRELQRRRMEGRPFNFASEWPPGFGLRPRAAG